MIIFLLIGIIIGLILQAVDVTWPRLKPGWAALALAAFLYLLRFLGVL